MSLDHDRRRRARFAALLSVAVLSVAASGCGSAGSAPRPKPSPSAAATPTGTSESGIPTGTQLLQLMPYHVGEPASWHVDPAVGAVRNSGSALLQPLGLLPDSSSCVYVGELGGPLAAVPWWPVSWAYVDIDRPSGTDLGLQLVALLMAGFRPGYATKQLNWETARAAACPTFIDSMSHLRVDTRSTVIHGLGDGALYIWNAYGVGTSVVAITETVIARVGNDIVVAQQHNDDAMVPVPELESMCRLLIQRVRTFR
jgi:hypothetical protein